METRRARRRRLTEKVAKRRQAEQDRTGFRPKSIVDRQNWAYQENDGLWYWSKNRPYSCGCTKRKPGVPRHNTGMCDFGRRERVYHWRAQVRELNHKLARGYNPDDDILATLSDPRSKSNTGLWRA